MAKTKNRRSFAKIHLGFIFMRESVEIQYLFSHKYCANSGFFLKKFVTFSKIEAQEVVIS